MKNKGFKPYILNTLLTIALCAAYALIGGGISLLIGMLISALLGVVFYREHYGLGIGNSVLILIIFMLFSGVFPALSNGVPIILLGLSLALGTRVKLSIYKLLLLCAFLFMADMMVGLTMLEQMTGGELTFSSMMLESGNQIAEIMGRQYADTESAEMIEEAIRMAMDVSITLAPAMFMIISTILAYILIVIYKKVQQKYGVDVSFLKSFDSLQGDKVVAFLYLILLLLIMVAPDGYFADVVANVFLVLSFLFVMAGVSVFDCKLKQRGLRKVMRRLTIVALFFVSLSVFLVPLMVFLICGITDSFRDFRGLRAKENEEK